MTKRRSPSILVVDGVCDQASKAKVCGRRGPLPSEIFRSEPGSLGDARQHAGPDLIAIVEGPDEVGEALALEHLVRSNRANP